MTPTRIAAAAARLLAWARRRAAERTTWVGLAAIASTFGYSKVSDHLTALADAVPLLVIAGGAGLAAASTSARPTPPAEAEPPSA